MDRQANKNKKSLGVFFSRLEVLLATACMREPVLKRGIVLRLLVPELRRTMMADRHW
jgi:hypothetical protein